MISVEILSEGYRRARGMVRTGKGRKVLEMAVPLWRQAQETSVGRTSDDRWTTFQREMAVLVGPV